MHLFFTVKVKSGFLRRKYTPGPGVQEFTFFAYKMQHILVAVVAYVFQCEEKHWVNTTATWYLEISDVMLQPFNLTNQDFGAVEDCTEDTKDSSQYFPVLYNNFINQFIFLIKIFKLNNMI